MKQYIKINVIDTVEGENGFTFCVYREVEELVYLNNKETDKLIDQCIASGNLDRDDLKCCEVEAEDITNDPDELRFWKDDAEEI